MCRIESSTQDESLVLPWLVEHAGCIQSRCQKGRDGKTPFERLHGKKPTQEFVPFGEKVLAKPISTDPHEQNESQIQVWDLAWHTKQQCRMFHEECRMVSSEPVKSEGWNLCDWSAMES